MMSPQLRLRSSQTSSCSNSPYKGQKLQHPLHNHNNNNSDASSSSSSSSIPDNGHQSNHLLSSSQMHQALHPHTSIISSSKQLPFHTTKSLSSSSSSLSIIKLIVPKILRMKFSTLFILGTMFALGSIHRLHLLALHAMPTEGSYGVSGKITNEHWNNNVLQNRLRTKRGLGRYPRVFTMNSDHAQSPFGESTTESSCTRSGCWINYLLEIFFPFWKKRITIDDPMLHHDGWKPSEEDYASTQSNYWHSSNEKTGANAKKQDAEESHQQCVPMAEWQTTSYPNCNTVHEIDLVRSSSIGSYILPPPLQHTLNTNKRSPRHMRRRQITHHPSILHQQYKYITNKYPDKDRKKTAKLNSLGIMREDDIEFLGQGWFRSAWQLDVSGIPQYDDYEEEFRFDESVVLKTLRIERDFLEEYYELHRRDALAMERLTFSPYVLDIHGYCGQSAINELANFGIEGMSSLEKVARSFRGMDHIEPVSKIKLQLASMVAAGVSHMHSIDYPDFPEEEEEEDDDDDRRHRRKERKEKKEMVPLRSNATLVHYDLNPRNIAIVRRGKPKLNDFNVAEFLMWDPSRKQTCGFKGRFREPWWRAPEEMHFHLDNYTDPAPLTEKIDVYSLGNILWDILTTHSPRGKMSKDLEAGIRPAVARGEMPPWPSDFNKTKLMTDPALKAIEQAMQKCLKAKPEDRPTAGEIAHELDEALDNLPEGFGDKEKWKREMMEQEKKQKEEKHGKKGDKAKA